MTAPEYDLGEEISYPDDEVSPLTGQTGPLPQPASWPLATPRGVDEHMEAAYRAFRRQHPKRVRRRQDGPSGVRVRPQSR